MTEASTQRFNHVAMSVPADLLSEETTGAIAGFYESVFGWTEMPGMTKHGELLVLRAHSNEQFVFISASEQPMQCAQMDHFGLSVATPEELDAILARARTYREKDERVRIIDKTVENFYDALELHNFYVGYLLPLMVEVQCYQWAEGLDADTLSV